MLTYDVAELEALIKGLEGMGPRLRAERCALSGLKNKLEGSGRIAWLDWRLAGLIRRLGEVLPQYTVEEIRGSAKAPRECWGLGPQGPFWESLDGVPPIFLSQSKPANRHDINEVLWAARDRPLLTLEEAEGPFREGEVAIARVERALEYSWLGYSWTSGLGAPIDWMIELRLERARALTGHLKELEGEVGDWPGFLARLRAVEGRAALADEELISFGVAWDDGGVSRTTEFGRAILSRVGVDSPGPRG